MKNRRLSATEAERVRREERMRCIVEGSREREINSILLEPCMIRGSDGRIEIEHRPRRQGDVVFLARLSLGGQCHG